MKKVPVKLKVFFTLIYVITICLLYIFYKFNYFSLGDFSFRSLVFFSFLIMLMETFTVTYNNMSFSTTFAITVAVYVLYGALPTIIVTLLGYSMRILKVGNKFKHIFNTPLYGTFFNYCALILPIIFGNYFYVMLGGTFQDIIVNSNLLQIAIFTCVFFLMNTIIISIMYSLFNNKNIIYSIFVNIRLLLLNTMLMSPFGIILAVVYNMSGYFGVLLLVFPIMLAKYIFSLYIDSKSQYTDTVDALMRAMEARDKYTEGHSQRVAEIVKEIASELKYNDWAIDRLYIASLLHDVGKIGIDDAILNKPGKLTIEEYHTIKSHPEIGFSILKDVKNLKDIVEIVKHHHERYDGKGYPDGLAGDQINLDVYIVQLADCIDAMSTDRPYRKALAPDKIKSEIEDNSGTQFHPKVANAYLNILKRQSKDC